MRGHAHGDRQTELVCIGEIFLPATQASVELALNDCTLTDEEMAGGEALWAALPDPFAAAWHREMSQDCSYV